MEVSFSCEKRELVLGLKKLSTHAKMSFVPMNRDGVESRLAGNDSSDKMYYTYIIYSKSLDRYYVGYTNDTRIRLEQHNSEKHPFSKFTTHAYDWELKYKEKFLNKTEAIKREREIKRWHSRKMIEKLINDASESR